MSKTYQNNAATATDIAVPDAVSVSMGFSDVSRASA